MASWRLGHEPSPLKHCWARAFQALSPAPDSPTTTVQPSCWLSSTPALLREKTSPVPPGGPTRQVPPSSVGRASDCGVVDDGTDDGVDVGVEAGRRGGRRRRRRRDGRGRRRRAGHRRPQPRRRGRRAGRRGGRRRRGAGRRAASPERSTRSACVEPGTVLLEPSVAPVTHCSTGRSVTMPATSAASRASRWSRTPGRSTTMLEPSTRTSGSAIPRFSSSLRTRSRMTMRSSSVAPSVGDITTETPPCRSSPRTGVLLRARLRASADDGHPYDAEERRPETPADHPSRVVASEAASSRGGRRAVGVVLRRRGRLRQRPPGLGLGRRDVDLALDGRPRDADLHVVVDLQPDEGPPAVVLVEAGDEPVDAGRRHHLVADLERRLEGLLLAHPPTLRPDHQEVHRQRDQQQDAELDDGGCRRRRRSSAARMVRRCMVSVFPIVPRPSGRVPSQPEMILRPAPTRTAPRHGGRRTCRRRWPPAGRSSAPASTPRCAR